jgi:Holliday junction resolvasome RuvABC endonuclease subunit
VISLILDQSTTKAGWALLRNGKLEDHGRITLKGNVRERIEALLKDVKELAGLFTPDELIIEDTRHIRQLTADTNMAMNVIFYELKNWAEDNGMGFYTQNPLTIKKQFTGSGKATKEEMKAMALQVTGIEPLDDNHADAIAGATVWAVMGEEIRGKSA